MVDELDLTRPIRGVVGLERLVRFVLASNPKNEFDWLEWKRCLPLEGPEGRSKAAKQILGFGNRDPDQARRRAGGVAYLVLGAEPGNLAGQPPMDPADIESGLRHYVGHAGPAWTPVWVTVDDTECLVISVEAPEWGDRIHTLRREYDSFHEGQVFVRRHGGTHRASADEMAMLERRLTRRRPDPPSIEVIAVPEPLTPVDMSDEALEAWIDAEREWLLAPLRAGRAREHQTPVALGELRRQLPPGAGERDILAAAQTVAQMMQQVQQSSAFAALHGKTIEESRSEDGYESEVENYLQAARPLLRDVALSRFVEVDGALLQLLLRNPTDRNLPEVELIVDFEGQVLSFDEVPDVEALPGRPRRWGPRTTDPLGSFRIPSYDFVSSLSAGPYTGYIPSGYESQNHGSTTIVYDAVDLRPRGQIELPPVNLVVSSDVGTELTGTWTATSTAVDGVSSGRLTVPISPDPMSLSEMLDDSDD